MNDSRWLTIRRLSIGLLTSFLVVSTMGCQSHDSTGDPTGPYGKNLPRSEAEFTAVGEAAMVLDADQSPLKRLDPVVGDWIIEGSFSAWPGSPVSPIAPICESKWILGKRCLQLRYRYTIPGEVISDLVIVAWNPLDEQYEIQLYSSGWPLPNHGTGHWNEDRKTLDFEIHTINPSTQDNIKTLYRLSEIQPDSHRWTQYRTNKSGGLEAFFIMNAKRAPAS